MFQGGVSTLAECMFLPMSVEVAVIWVKEVNPADKFHNGQNVWFLSSLFNPVGFYLYAHLYLDITHSAFCLPACLFDR